MPHNQVKRDTSQLHGVPRFATGHVTGKVVHRVPVTSLGAYASAAAEFVASKAAKLRHIWTRTKVLALVIIEILSSLRILLLNVDMSLAR